MLIRKPHSTSMRLLLYTVVNLVIQLFYYLWPKKKSVGGSTMSSVYDKYEEAFNSVKS